FTEPVDGGLVAFTAPATGASVTFAQSLTQTITNGAVSITATANGRAGAYTVTAGTHGASNVDFALTNVGYTLTTAITGTGGGTVAVHPDGDYDYGAVVTVTATPFISSTFTGWSGDCDGAGACVVTMTQARAVTAMFAIKRYVLTPTAGIGGAITPGTPQTVTYGSDLAFAITPDTGYHISDVLVDGVSVGAQSGYTFTTITADHTLSATFARNAYTLTVHISGAGTVTRVPSQTTYLYGDAVTLTAVPAADWYFGQWTGDASGISMETAVTMDADKVITAMFLATPPTYYTLTVHLVGNGVVTPGVGAHSYLSGTVADLRATPAAGWQFDDWSGDLASVANPTTLLMDGDKEVTATFTLKPAGPVSYTLTLAVAGNGQGTVTPGVGVHEYLSGTTALVTATAQAGSAFIGWSGAATGAANPVAIPMTADQVLTATFQDVHLAAFTLTAQPAAVYANGLDEVTLHFTATTATGNGAPFAGRVVTLQWTHGFYASPVTATLDAAGSGTARYVAGVVPGTATFTATLTDTGIVHTATAAVELRPNPLTGALDFVVGHELITYTFVLTNASGGSQTGVVLTGSIPVDTALVGVTGGFTVTTGGDYDWGYVTSPITPKMELEPGASYTLTWTVRPLGMIGDIITQAHAESDTARLRLGIVRRVYRILLPMVFRNARF
ncbi:MAG: hypothetical protein JXA33_14385, partial [Anaerolineae bacterium]|nr:hypothetical protein [Anaerolineae bacterium]